MILRRFAPQNDRETVNSALIRTSLYARHACRQDSAVFDMLLFLLPFAGFPTVRKLTVRKTGRLRCLMLPSSAAGSGRTRLPFESHYNACTNTSLKLYSCEDSPAA